MKITSTGSSNKALQFAAGIILLIMALPLYAASATFVATPTDSNWATGTNWSPGVSPGNTIPTTTADIATFNATVTNGFGLSGSPLVIDTNRAIGSILFDTSAASPYVIGASNLNALTLSGGGSITMNPTVVNSETINAPILFRQPSIFSAYSFINNSTTVGATLNFGGTITQNGGGSALQITLGGSNTGANTISGNITVTSFGQNANALIKTGAGTWVLTGTDTFSGSPSKLLGISITGGTLQFGDGVIHNGNITVTNGINASANISNAGTLNFANPLPQTYSSIISGTGTVNKLGAGTLILNGVNTYTGLTTISAGTLQLGASTGGTGSISNTSAVVDNANLTYYLNYNQPVGYPISGTGTLTKTGGSTNFVYPGTLTLTNASSYTGATQVSNGTLVLDHSGANTGALGNTAITVGSAPTDATLLVKGSTTIGTGTGASLTLFGAQSRLDLRDNTINTLTLNGNLALKGALLQFDLGPTLGASDLLQVAGTVTETKIPSIGLSSPGGLTPGAYTLITAAGGLGGAFNISAYQPGFYTYALNKSTATQEILTVGGNPAPATAYWTGLASSTGATTDPNNNWGYGSYLSPQKSNWSTTPDGLTDPVQVPGAVTDVIFTAANATPSSGTTTLTTQLDGSYSIHSLTFAVPAATGITATVINTPSTTSSNSLTIGSGGLTLNSSADPTNPNASTGTVYGDVRLNGSQSWANNDNALTLSITGSIAPLAGATFLTLNGTGSGGVTLGNIGDGTGVGGSLALVLAQAGVTQLNGLNTFTGGMTLNSGIVQLDYIGALNYSSPVTFGPNSTGDLRINGLNETAGALTTNAALGAPIIENQNATAAALTVNPVSGTATYGGILQDGAGGGSLALTKTGAGAQVLTGANTYTGGTSINGGVLNAGVAENAGIAGPFGASGLISFGGGVLQYSAANQFDYSSRFSAAAGQKYNIDTNGQNVTFANSLNPTSGSLTKQGLGTLTLNAANTFSSITTLNAGTLIVADNSALGNAASGAALNVTGPATADFTSAAPAIGGLNSSQTSSQVVLGNTSNSTPTALTITIFSGGNFAGTISDGSATNAAAVGSLIVSGHGSQTLSGANSYTGGTTVSNGTLILTNSAGSSATGTGAVALNPTAGVAGAAVSATLSGTGVSTGAFTAAGSANNTAVLTPSLNSLGQPQGSAPGTLSIGTIGGAALTTASLMYDLSANGTATASAGSNDAIATGGTLSLGTLTCYFYEATGTLDMTTPYTLISGAVSSTLQSGASTANFAANTTFTNGPQYTPVYNLTANGLTVQFAAAPEPGQTATLGLIGIGVIGLLLRARRGRRE